MFGMMTTAIVRYAIVAGFALMMALPLMWAISGSLHTNQELFAQPFAWFPSSPQFVNYSEAWQATSFARQLFNSFLVAISVTLCGTVVAHMAGYALSKRHFAGRDIIFWSIVATMMVPFPAYMIGVFIVAKHVGILDSYLGMTLPVLVSGYTVFFMRQYLSAVPDELLESARIDGASEWQIYRKIAVPLSRPVMASMGILTFVAVWNGLLWPLVVVRSKDLYTVPLGLTEFSTKYFTDYVAILSLSVVSMIPVALLFILNRRRLLDSIMVSGGGLKG